MFFNILSVFLWKNIKRIQFFWKTNLILLIFPLVIITFLFYFSSNDYDIREEYTGENSLYIKRQFDVYRNESILSPEWLSFGTEDYLYYTPNDTEFLKELMESVRNKLNILDESVVGFETTNDLYHDPLFLNGSNVITIIFEKSYIPNELNYVIQKKSNDFETEKIYQVNVRDSIYTNPYIHNGFITLQYAIESSFLELKLNLNIAEVTIQHSPVNYVRIDKGLDITLFAWTSAFAFISVYMSLILHVVVEEKQDGVKEIISIATTHSYINQLAIFLTSFVICSFSMFLLMSECIYYNLFQCINIVFPFLLMLLFSCCMISFTFFVSTFFDSVTFSMIIGFLFYFVPIFVFRETSTLNVLKFLSPCTMYVNGMELLKNFLESQRCFVIRDIFHKGHPVDGYSLFEIYISLFFTSFLYFFLYYYLSNVFPGRSGTPRPFYFLCMPSFYKSKKIEEETATPLSFIQSQSCPSSFVKICELSKVFQRIPYFGDYFTAVNNISFDLPENHITILLGHNGAGKTTTMSMITGITPPTHGRIYVGSECDVNKYRSCIGYCPQHDVFISYLNCKDHLIFFGRLRGLSTDQAHNEANIILEKVRLSKFANKPAKTLSSGMKRRLCLACAVIGKTKLVILDEPSSGLDPESRRDLWDVLLPLRKERTILLTTHSMEEADVLGDKIVIMESGKIQCEGTQFELKKRYGNGYSLKILTGEHFKKTETVDIIKKIIPNAIEKSYIHPTLMYALPYDSISDYKTVLKELEKNKISLGIESLSMANTTMEEVFLNSASKEHDPRFGKDEVDAKYTRLEDQSKNSSILALNQIIAIFYKKYIFIKRSWIKTIIHSLLPIVFIFLSYYTQLKLQSSVNEAIFYKSLEIKASHIKNPEIILLIDSNIHGYTHFVETFHRLAESNKAKATVINDTQLEKVMEHIEKTDNIRYYENLIAALDVRPTYNSDEFVVNAMYQGNILYSNPYALNLAFNFLLQFYSFSNNTMIRVANSPLPKIGPPMELSYVFIHTLQFYFTFGFFFYILFYVSLPYYEEESEFRIIQNIPSSLYWFSSFLFDMLVHTFLCVIYVILIALCDQTNKLPNLHIAYLLLVFSFSGYVHIALLYLLVKCFKKLSTIYSILTYIFFGSAIAAVTFKDQAVVLDHPILFNIFRLFPQFNLQHYISQVILIAGTKAPLELFAFYVVTILEICLFLLFIIFVFENIYVRAIVEKFMTRINPKYLCKKQIEQEPVTNDDIYVQREQDVVNNAVAENKMHDFALLVSSLEKYYADNFHAVRGISFSVEKGECFGLLGMNGAGKSTTFKMMTLNNALSKGDIYINGYHVKKQKSLYHQQFGYCPEVHALLDFMTAYELLQYMALIKGTHFSKINSEAIHWLTRMDLVKYKNILVRNYSGGTKRKLNTAISMISCPDLIFLDEPTSGVDPISRRFMWKCIKEFQSNLNTIVLTSHSMDECEELCNRLAIMSTGHFKCLGYIQRLKNAFGTGFTLYIKIREGIHEQEKQNLKLDIANLYRCTLRDDYAGTLIYNVHESDIIWSEIFEKLLNFREKYKKFVDDFAINEISLEDIFLKFRKIGFENGDVEISRL